MTRQSKAKALKRAAAFVGWIWLLSLPFSLWFLVIALFSNGGWSGLLICCGVGFVSKSLRVGFDARAERVAMEGEFVAGGIPEHHARELAFAAVTGGTVAVARKAHQLGVALDSGVAPGNEATPVNDFRAA